MREVKSKKTETTYEIEVSDASISSRPTLRCSFTVDEKNGEITMVEHGDDRDISIVSTKLVKIRGFAKVLERFISIMDGGAS